MKDLKKKSEKDLNKLLQEKRDELRDFRFASAGSHKRNTKEGHNLRKDIAKILTELNLRTKVTN